MTTKQKPLKNIVFSVVESLSAFKPTDDFDIPFKLIAEKADDIRLVLLREYYDRNIKIPEGFFQRVCCLELKCENRSCDGVLPSPYKEWYVELPDIDINVGNSIKYFGLIDMDNPFTHTTFSGYSAVRGRRFTSGETFYTVLSTATGYRALVKNKPTMGTKYLCLIAALEHPQSACDFDEDVVYPIPGNLVHKLEYLMIRHFSAGMSIPKDLLSDAADRLGQDTSGNKTETDDK